MLLNSGKDPASLERGLLDCFKTNTVANVHLFNIFMPLILKGNQKKVITISSGMADIDITRKYDVSADSAYSISKAAMNVVVAKFSSQYAQQGVLFLSICPGMVNTGHHDNSK
jgi:NAD(P)-dependent dehydrogenase (short-subunit alcohol dehydrogenase family)